MKNKFNVENILETEKRRNGETGTDVRALGGRFADSPIRRLTASVGVILVAVLLGLSLTGCGKSDSQAQDGKRTAKFFCPMHPTYTSDRQGDCPICNMKLVPVKDAGASGAISEHGDHEKASVPGRVEIFIAPEKRQLIGVRTATVARRHLSETIRASGLVVHDERLLTRVAPRFGGWVRKLHVNFTGAPVQKGQPLFSVYSPELFATENEYLVAWRNLNQLTNASPAMRESAKRMLDSARRRLELMQVDEAEIAGLEKSGKPSDELIFRAPTDGHVVTKNAVEGKAFMAGDTLYEIADLSHLWIQAAVSEYELPQISTGQKAKVTFPYLNQQAYETEVSFINPHIDSQTRRAEIRLEVTNANHVLRPDMWANVEIFADIGEVLAIPASAVINTGTRWVAFVDREDQHLEPREVKIGARTDEYYEVREGLNEGERVVTRALFLVDSESQLKAAVSGMGAAGEHNH